MAYKKFSIVTPSYNQGPFLERTIDSVLSQNYKNLEYMIIDGGSTDNSLEIIKKYEKYLDYWISEKDAGQTEAINKGLMRSTGEVFNWLNSDDFYEPNVLPTISEFFQDDSINVVCAKGYIVDKNENRLTITNGTDIYSDNHAKTLGWARIDQPETFIRKSCYNKLGHLNAALKYTMDREFWIRYLLNNDLSTIKVIDDRVVNFRWHKDSKTVSLGNEFDAESNYIFYSLALQNKFDNIGNVIKENCKLSEPFNISLKAGNEDLVRKSLNYFLLLKADEQYQKNNKRTVQKLLDSIDIGLLAQNDVERYKKIYLRNKYLPGFLLSLIRTIKQKK